MNWNLVAFVGLIIVAVIGGVWWTKYSRKRDARLRRQAEVDAWPSSGAVIKALRPLVMAALEEKRKTLPDIHDLLNCVYTSDGWVCQTVTAHLNAFGGLEIKAAKLPGGAIGIEVATIKATAMEGIAQYQLGTLLPGYTDRLNESIEAIDRFDARRKIIDSVSSALVNEVSVLWQEMLSETCDELESTGLCREGWSIGYQIDRTPITELLFPDREALNPWGETSYADVSVKRMTYYKVGVDIHLGSLLIGATPEKFDEFNANQDTHLQQTRDYIALLFGEAFGHPKNITKLGTLLDNYLSENRNVLVRNLDKTNDVSIELDGVLSPRLDINFTNNRMGVGITVPHLETYLHKVYSKTAFFNVLGTHLLQYLNAAMQQQYPNWEITETGANVTVNTPSGDSRLPQAKFHYWLNDVPPHRRNHDSDSQA